MANATIRLLKIAPSVPNSLPARTSKTIMSGIPKRTAMSTTVSPKASVRVK